MDLGYQKATTGEGRVHTYIRKYIRTYVHIVGVCTYIRTSSMHIGSALCGSTALTLSPFCSCPLWLSEPVRLTSLGDTVSGKRGRDLMLVSTSAGLSEQKGLGRKADRV